MSNLRVIYDNAADRATLSSSATQGTLGVSNLLSDIKSKVCRSTGTSLSVSAVWSTPETIGGVAMPFTNLSPTATARVRLTGEASVTNMLTTSEVFSASPWTKTNCITTPFAAAAPDGSANSQFLREDGSTSAHELRTPSITLTSGTTYTMSVFAKQGTRRYVRLGFSSVFVAANSYVVFDLQTGAVSSTGSGTATGTITQAPNGFYRCVVTCAVTTSATGTNYIGLQSDAVTTTYTGNGASGISLWGAQLEVGNGATSYYPSADTFTSRGSAATYIANDGTMKLAASNVARYSYNPNNLSAPPKLMVDIAVTNYVSASGTLTTGWSGCSVAAATGTTYRGYETYQTVSKATSSASESLSQTFNNSISAGTKYTSTIALRAGSSSVCSVGLYDSTSSGTAWGATGDSVCIILEGPGTAVQTSGGLFTISNLSATVDTLVQITRNYTAVSIGVFSIYPAGSTSTTSGASILATRVQVEGIAWPTSYFPTTTVAATRSADVWTSPLGTRPVGYIDTWQSYAYDSGTILFSPAPYKIIHGLTPAQASSAYAYGGGKYASHWLPSKINAYGMTVDIVDTVNLQGYVEVSRLVCGDYWNPSVVDVQNTSLQVVDTSSHTRTDAGDLYTYVGTKHRKQVINLPSIEPTSRKQLWDIMFGNGMSKPLFISLFPNNADASLEANHMLYGKLVTSPSMSTPYFSYQAATIEIEEV